MSKKSRKRNKKILAALALAGGAAMLAKGRGKGIAQGVSGADKAASCCFIARCNFNTKLNSSIIFSFSFSSFFSFPLAYFHKLLSILWQSLVHFSKDIFFVSPI